MRDLNAKKLIIRFLLILPFLYSVLLFTSCNRWSPESQTGEPFSWQMARGDSIDIFFSQHPYTEAIIKKIADFEELTGIDVVYSVSQEDEYFDLLYGRLASRRDQPDLFMSGAYQLWDLMDKGFVENLDPYLSSPALTEESYNPRDFFPAVYNSLRWNRDTYKLGEGPLLALPLGFELITLAYNRRIFDEKGLTPPATMEELYRLCGILDEFDGPGSFAISVRGADNWATIHPGYMTTFGNYGAVDAENISGNLVSRVNSPESLEMNRHWIDMVRTGGAENWGEYNWYKTGAALGDGRAAMLFDADIVGYFQNIPGSSREAGNIAWVKAPVPEARAGDPVRSNLWIWSLAMNSRSREKKAAWLFLQYFTGPEYQLWAAVNEKAVDPPRRSVFNDPSLQEILSLAEGYEQAFRDTIETAGILFTPQPHFIETTSLWASSLRRLVMEENLDVQQELDSLKNRMDQIFSP